MQTLMLSRISFFMIFNMYIILVWCYRSWCDKFSCLKKSFVLLSIIQASNQMSSNPDFMDVFVLTVHENSTTGMRHMQPRSEFFSVIWKCLFSAKSHNIHFVIGQRQSISQTQTEICYENFKEWQNLKTYQGT